MSAPPSSAAHASSACASPVLRACRALPLGGLALALAGSALAASNTDLQVVTIQPIAVCNTDGSGCGNAQGLINDAVPYVNANFARLNMAVTFLPVAQFNDSSYTTTVVDQNRLTDQSRRLMRDPGHSQNPNPQVLNMFFVPNLQGTPGQGLPLAYSFVNGNGLIIGPNPRTDTIAHEISHNLGLDHTTFGAGASTNLVTTGTARLSPTDPSQVSSNALDQLTSQQAGQLRAPLFSVNQTRMVTMLSEGSAAGIPGARTSTLITVSPDGYPNLFRQPGPGGLPAGQDPAASPSSLPNGLLTQVRVRFLSSTPVALTNPELAGRLETFTSFVTDPSFRCGTSLFVPDCTSDASFQRYTLQGTRNLPAGAVEFVWNMQGAVIDSRQVACVSTGIPGQPCYYAVGNLANPSTPGPFRPYDAFSANFYDPVCAASWQPGQPLCAAPRPFSVQFNFSNGFASQGFYDTATGIADPLNPNLPGLFSWAPGTGPMQTLDESQLPVSNTGAIEFAAVDVPEPAASGPFAAALGLLGLALVGRRRPARAA